MVGAGGFLDGSPINSKFTDTPSVPTVCLELKVDCVLFGIEVCSVMGMFFTCQLETIRPCDGDECLQ